MNIHDYYNIHSWFLSFQLLIIVDFLFYTKCFISLLTSHITIFKEHYSLNKIYEKIKINSFFQEISLRLGYNMRWPEHRMVLNDSADWSRGEINVSPDIIKNFWVPDIVIHDLVRYMQIFLALTLIMGL